MSFHLSASSIATYLVCPKKFELSRTLRPKEVDESLHIGSAVHSLFEKVFVGGMSIDDFLKENEQRMETLSEKQYHKMLGIIKGVYQHFPYHEQIKGMKSEIEFDVTLHKKNGRTIFDYGDLPSLKGWFDGVTEDWIIEIKTTARPDILLSGDYLRTNFQVAFYNYIARKLNLGKKGVRFIVITKPLLRLRKNDTPWEFQDRIVDEMGKDLEKYFHYSDISFAEDSDFEKELGEIIKRIKFDKRNGFLRNHMACTTMGKCSFLPICTNAPGWESMYEPR